MKQRIWTAILAVGLSACGVNPPEGLGLGDAGVSTDGGTLGPDAGTGGTAGAAGGTGGTAGAAGTGGMSGTGGAGGAACGGPGQACCALNTCAGGGCCVSGTCQGAGQSCASGNSAG